MTNKSQIDPEHLSFNSLRILRFCHLNMFKERHTYYHLFSELRFTCVIISVFQCCAFVSQSGCKYSNDYFFNASFSSKNFKKN